VESVVARIEDLLNDDLELIVMFGSMATDSTHALSDLDIGVRVTAPEEKHMEIQGNLLSLFDSTTSPRVDVTLLNLASMSLLFRVVRDGKVLFARDSNAWPSFVEFVLIRYPDWNYYIEDYLRQSVGA
jgi:predicted nucleotidyltransferase